MNNKVLIIMCGYPYSGKTTVAKQIEEKLKFNRITVDEVLVELNYKLGQQLSEKEWDKVYQFALGRLADSLLQGKNTIFDATNVYRSFRDVLRSIADKYKYLSVVVYVDTPKNIVLERDENVVGRHKAVGLMETINNMSIPTEGENIIVVKPQTNILMLIDELRQKTNNVNVK